MIEPSNLGNNAPEKAFFAIFKGKSQRFWSNSTLFRIHKTSSRAKSGIPIAPEDVTARNQKVRRALGRKRPEGKRVI